MSWSDFTIENVKHFKKNKIHINKESPLLTAIKNERKLIKNFIKKFSKLHIKINKVKQSDLKSINKKIIKYSNVDWVDSECLKNDLPNLDKIYEIIWLTPVDPNINNSENKMYIQTTDKVISKIIKRLKILIFIGEYLKYKTNNTNKIFNIFLILSNLKRFFPDDNKKIMVRHVNGGYTDTEKNIIFVWRYEEFEKVFIHEVIHYIDMDSRHQHVNIDVDINGPTSFYEALTDFWAIFYHLIYLSLITRLPILNLLELELTFIENQAMTLNDHFNLGSWDYPLTNTVFKSTNTILQSTPAFSYYILKYLLFNYFLENKLTDIHDYNTLINKIVEIGLITKPYIKLESSRMSLLQLD